jgi:Flp pilus assembly protein CpaB
VQCICTAKNAGQGDRILQRLRFIFFRQGVIELNRRRQIALSLAAAALAAILVYGVYWLQLRQVKWQETIEVVVPRQFVPAGTTLDADMLTTVALPAGAVTGDMMTRVGEAVGMETSAPLGTKEPLLRWKLQKYPLLPKKGESTFQIPKEYIKSVSNGIRAGDRVSVFLSSERMPSRKLFDRPIVVASVKTAANLEIDNPKNPNLLSLAEGDKEKMYASRRDANGAIDAVNLNLTEDQWLELDSACKGGAAKVVIAFDAAAIGPGEEESK